MYYWICVRADSTAGLFQTEPKKIVSYDDFSYIKSECGMEYAEVVTIEHQGDKYMMLVDEEGKLNHRPYNAIADVLYHNPYDAIVGDVAILEHSTDDEMRYLDEADALKLWNYIALDIKRYRVDFSTD